MKQSPLERGLIPALLLVGVVALVYVGSDGVRSFIASPACTLNSLTGLLCPVCGGTRAVQWMLQGNFHMAWLFNPLVVLLTPFAVFTWFYLLYLFIKGIPLSVINFPIALTWALFVVVILFGVIRNLPYPVFEPLRFHL